MVSLMVSLRSQMSIKAASALLTTVGFSSLSIMFKRSIKSLASTIARSWSYNLATVKAAVLRTYGSESFKSFLSGPTVASTNWRTWIYEIVRSASARVNGFESFKSSCNVGRAFNARSGFIRA